MPREGVSEEEFLPFGGFPPAESTLSKSDGGVPITILSEEDDSLSSMLLLVASINSNQGVPFCRPKIKAESEGIGNILSLSYPLEKQ